MKHFKLQRFSLLLRCLRRWCDGGDDGVGCSARPWQTGLVADANAELYLCARVTRNHLRLWQEIVKVASWLAN